MNHSSSLSLPPTLKLTHNIAPIRFARRKAMKLSSCDRSGVERRSFFLLEDIRAKQSSYSYWKSQKSLPMYHFWVQLHLLYWWWSSHPLMSLAGVFYPNLTWISSNLISFITKMMDLKHQVVSYLWLLCHSTNTSVES